MPVGDGDAAAAQARRAHHAPHHQQQATTNMLLRSGNVTGLVHVAFSLDGETWFDGLYSPDVD